MNWPLGTPPKDTNNATGSHEVPIVPGADSLGQNTRGKAGRIIIQKPDSKQWPLGEGPIKGKK